MRTCNWLIGLTLCIVGIGSAYGTSMATQNLDAGDHASADSGSSHISEGGGDALGLSHDSTSHDSNDTHSDTSTSTSPSRRGNGAATLTTPTRQSHVSWQSLLPGSIQ